MTPTANSVTFPKTAPVSKLNRKHGYFEREHENWDGYDLLSRGGAALKNEGQRFLIKGEKEMQDVYLERLKRFTYQNILGTVIGWYVSKLFARDPEIHFQNAGSTDTYAGKNKDWYSQFLLNCDRSGTTYVDLWRSMAQNLLTFKDAWICVDLPHSDQEYASRAQQKQAGALDPYVMMYDPRNIINWAVDAYGNFEWVLIYADQQSQEFLGPAKAVQTWYYYNRTEYAVYRVEKELQDVPSTQSGLVGPDGRPILESDKAQADLIDSGPHALAKFNRVPVRYVSLPESLHLASRMYLPAQAHLNLENDSLYGLHRTNVPMPVFFTEAEISPVISAVGYWQLKPADKVDWLAPKPETYKISQDILAELRQEIYRQAYLMAQGRDSSAAAASASGYSKEVDMMPSREVLSAIGDCTRANMQLVLTDVRDARGDKDLDFDVRGFNFQNNPAIQEAEIAELIQSLEIQSDAFDKEVQKKVAIAYLSDANPDIVEKVVDEIDKAPKKSDLDAQAAQQMKDQMLNNARMRNRSIDAVGSQASAAA